MVTGYKLSGHVTATLLALSVSATQLFSCRGAPEHDDRKSSPACCHCGMNRERFGHARMLITYDDGNAAAVCSLHCAALDLALNSDRRPAQIQVGDFDTQKLIDARTAYWVLGGDKAGVMSQRAKWAFATQSAAEAFKERHGGSRAIFFSVLRAAYEDMQEDVAMLR